MKAEFNLRMGNGARVRTLNGLLQHFDMQSALDACRSGELGSWLASAGHPNRAEAVSRVDLAAPDAPAQLLAALDLDPFTSARLLLGLNDPAIRKDREQRLGALTDNPDILVALDCTALDQQDLDALSPLGLDQIYLCGNEEFTISPALAGVMYTGVGRPLVRFAPGPVARGVDCEGVRFNTSGFVRDNLLGLTLEAAPDYYFPQFWDNPELGVRILTQVAEEGDHRAQTLLSRCWLERYGTQDAEYLPPMPRLGAWGRGEPHFKEWQDGSTQSHAQASKWAQRAAGQGDPAGMLILSQCCRLGWGVPVDEAKADSLREEAMRVLREGAQSQDPVCQYNLACLIRDGQLRREATQGEDARQWLEAAAHLGLARAQCEMAHESMHMRDGGAPDLPTAYSWYQKAAQQGDASGLASLGDFYYFGDLVEPDESRAVSLYHKAAMRGNQHAQERLAECLECGFGVDADLDAAAYWRRRIDRHKQRFAYKYGWSGKWEREEDRAVVMRQFRLDQQGARDGNLDAMHGLAWDYLRGIGTVQDTEKGLALLQEALEAGHVPSIHSLAQIHERGEFVPADPEIAMRLYETAAERGDVESQMTMSRRYTSGNVMPQDLEKAAYWLMQAASQGHEGAEYELGLCYARGRGVPQDAHRAVSWLSKAAQRGHDKAQYTLGALYLNGEALDADPEQAARYFHMAADNNNADAQFALGLMYNEGTGVEKNASEAVHWYGLAAENGHARSQCNLGAMYHKGEGVERDDALAAHWYLLAAEQGHPRSQCNLARMYELGEGVEKDLAEAMRWYRKAAENGNPSAQCNLGCMYERGEGAQRNEAEAVRWFLMAAERGHARSQYNLGCMYEGGRGVSRSRSEAARWYKKAAKQGQPNAQLSLARCYRHGIGVMMSPRKAEYWQGLAAEQGYSAD